MSLYVKLVCSDDIEPFLEDYQVFLDTIALSDSPALPNMGNDAPAGLLYIAKQKLRWTKDQGQIAFLYDDDKIVGVSCVEHSTLDADIGSGGNRCWLLENYRQHNEVSKFLLSANLDWCRARKKKGMLLTFNNYNKWIYNAILRISIGTGKPLGTVWSRWWNDCIIFPRMIRLFSTPQWAVIKPTDKEYIIDLNKIILNINVKHGVNRIQSVAE